MQPGRGSSNNAPMAVETGIVRSFPKCTTGVKLSRDCFATIKIVMTMSDVDKGALDDLLDALMDLKHDLGKYIRLPIAMLPREAGAHDVRLALETCLRNTRKGGGGVLSARLIWDSFLEEVGSDLEPFETFHNLKKVVSRALSLEDQLENTAVHIDRQDVEAKLSAVKGAIQAVIEEVNSE